MKIPPEAKLVFKGILFDVYQWQQKQFDGTYATFERIKRKYSVDVIATAGDKILLSHQSQPHRPDFYAVFGGRIEPGEDALTAAKRELSEEGGLASSEWELYKVYTPEDKIDWEINAFIAKKCSRLAGLNLDAGEKGEVIECNFDEFIDIVLSEKFWGDELVMEILRLKNDNKLEEFKRRILS
jgi:ADP-ribose pyrophosphatase